MFDSKLVLSTSATWPTDMALGIADPVQQLRKALDACALMHNDLVNWHTTH